MTELREPVALSGPTHGYAMNGAQRLQKFRRGQADQLEEAGGVGGGGGEGDAGVAFFLGAELAGGA